MPPLGEPAPSDERAGFSSPLAPEIAARFHAFDDLDEGFFLTEVIFDGERPVDLSYIYANPAATRMLGEDWSGRRLSEIDPGFESYWLEIWGEVVRTGKAMRTERYAAPLDVWYDFVVYPANDGDPHHVANLWRDVTERHRAQEALRESETRLRALVEPFAQVVWEADARGLGYTDSPSWRALTGQTAEEQQGEGWIQAVSPEDRDELLRWWREAVRLGLPVNTDVRVRAADGTERWMEVRAAPVRAPDGRIEKWVGMNLDTTERRASEQALREAEVAQLERERRAREAAEAFIAVMSHELKTPVTSIFAAASLLHRLALGPQAAELLSDIETEAARLAQIIDDLLVLSAVGSDHIPLVSEPVLLSHALAEVLSHVRKRFPRAEFRDALPRDLPPVLADSTATRHILGNLLTNAGKYASKAGPVEILGRDAGEWVEVDVLDRGPGPGPDPEALFGLFYRAKHTAHAAAGTGIGLYVTRALTQALGGTVACSAREGGGACFRLRLPTVQEAIEELGDPD